jgi:hypothetical protein
MTSTPVSYDVIKVSELELIGRPLNGNDELVVNDLLEAPIETKRCRVIDLANSIKQFILPIASDDTLGGIKVGEGLIMNPFTGVLDVREIDLGYVQDELKGTITNSYGLGTDIPLATTTFAGLMTAEEKGKINLALDRVDLSYATAFDSGTIGNTAGTNAIIPLATTVNAGLFSPPEKIKLDQALTFVNLDYIVANDRGTVTNTGGTDSTIPLATTVNAGLLAPAEKVKINESLSEVNLGYIPTGTNGTVTNDAGTNAIVPLATTTNAGLFSPSEKTKLDIALTTVNLGYVTSTTNGTVTNSAGSDSVIPSCTFSHAGLMTPSEKATLADSLSGVNLSYSASPVRGVINNDAGTDCIVPLATSTNAGLLAPDEKIKLSSGIVEQIVPGTNVTISPAGGKGTVTINADASAVVVSANPPSNVHQGDLWMDSNTGILYIYYVDANSSQWISVGGAGRDGEGGGGGGGNLDEVLNEGNASDTTLILGTNNSVLPTNIREGINDTNTGMGLFVEGQNLVVAANRNTSGNSENGVLIGPSGAIEIFRAANTGFIDFKTSAEFRGNTGGVNDDFDWRFMHQNNLFKVLYSDPATSQQVEILSLSPTGQNQINGGATPVKAFISGGNFGVGETNNSGGVLLAPSGAIEIWNTQNFPRIDFKTTGDFTTSVDDYDWRQSASPDNNMYFGFGVNGVRQNNPLILLAKAGNNPTGGVIISGTLNGSPARLSRGGVAVPDIDLDEALDDINVSMVDSRLSYETTTLDDENEFIFNTPVDSEQYEGTESVRTVNYDAVIALLIATVKRQKAQIEALQNHINP